LPEFHLDHFNDSNSSNTKIVLLNVMTEVMLAYSPSLDATIDSFMAGSCSVHCIVVLDRDGISRKHDSVVTMVAMVCNNFFSH